jgi:hypothetical protein
VASTSRGSGSGSTALSNAIAQNRSREVSVSIIRAAARRAATIFQPRMLPERSITNTTSRGFAATEVVLGGTIVRANAPPLPDGSSAHTSVVCSAAPSIRQRTMKSRSSRSPGWTSMTWASRRDTTTAWRLDATSRIAPSSSATRSPSRTGFGQPGSSTGGEIREASGTRSVSGARPSPA